MRSYFVGYSATPADLAVFGALKASPVFGRQAKSNSVKQNLGRWYSHIASLPAIKQAGELLEKAFPNNATAGGANATG